MTGQRNRLRRSIVPIVVMHFEYSLKVLSLPTHTWVIDQTYLITSNESQELHNNCQQLSLLSQHIPVICITSSELPNHRRQQNISAHIFIVLLTYYISKISLFYKVCWRNTDYKLNCEYRAVAVHELKCDVCYDITAATSCSRKCVLGVFELLALIIFTIKRRLNN